VADPVALTKTQPSSNEGFGVFLSLHIAVIVRAPTNHEGDHQRLCITVQLMEPAGI
jgi:hypothetical protein